MGTHYKWFKEAFAGSHLFVGILVTVVTAKGNQFYMTLTRDPRDTSAMIRDLSKGWLKITITKSVAYIGIL